MISDEQQLQKMEQLISEIDAELAPHREAMHAASRRGNRTGRLCSVEFC